MINFIVTNKKDPTMKALEFTHLNDAYLYVKSHMSIIDSQKRVWNNLNMFNVHHFKYGSSHWVMTWKAAA